MGRAYAKALALQGATRIKLVDGLLAKVSQPAQLLDLETSKLSRILFLSEFDSTDEPLGLLTGPQL